MGLLDFFSHLYRSHTLLFGLWYVGSATSWDKDGFIEGSIGVADFKGRLGLGSIRLAQSPRWEEIKGKDHVHAYQRKMARAFKKWVKPKPL